MQREATTAVAGDAEVTEVARRVIVDPEAQLLDWVARPISHVGIIDTTGGLYVVGGRVRSGGAEVPWSCVLKVLVRPPDAECRGPASWCYWRREAAFYGSQLPAALPGALRAPRPYAICEAADQARVWMEQVVAPARRWRLEDFGRAARAAGESAGAFLRNRPLPGESWLARGFLHSILGDGGFWATTMHPETGDTWRSPLSKPFGEQTREGVLRLWAERDALLSVTDRLPHVFGHGDFHPRNILLPADTVEVVALDWAFCGAAPLGADLADLVLAPAWFCDIEISEVPAVERVAFEAYDAGLRAAGWDGDSRVLRLGYALAIALRWAACVPGWAVLMLGPQRAPSSETLYGRSTNAILGAWVELAQISLELAEEARKLARQLGLDQA